MRVSMKHFFLKDDNPPPAGKPIPGEYLFMKDDKPDWTLQILLCFFIRSGD